MLIISFTFYWLFFEGICYYYYLLTMSEEKRTQIDFNECSEIKWISISILTWNFKTLLRSGSGTMSTLDMLGFNFPRCVTSRMRVGLPFFFHVAWAYSSKLSLHTFSPTSNRWAWDRLRGTCGSGQEIYIGHVSYVLVYKILNIYFYISFKQTNIFQAPELLPRGSVVIHFCLTSKFLYLSSF